MKFIKYCFLIITFCACTSCGVYSLTGASIDPDVKTFTVHYIANQAQIVIPTLSQSFTEALKNKLSTGTNLKMVESSGDLEFQGAITQYNISPAAAVANETAALNRITISVSIEFINHKNEKQSWTSTFSRYADYSSSQDLASVQVQLIDDINSQLVDDIFNKAVVNW
ncbi:MAG: LptE family protein [Chitinophagales bacterium]|nr:LptE family protein [Chitinophagales bacterium]